MCIFLAIINSSLAEPATIKITPLLSAQATATIARKIWQNECGGKISGLTSWNEGENFASLGIGHFIWYPKGQQEIFEEGFPKLIQYMHMQHIAVPMWLDKSNIPACPWQSREELLRAIQNRDPRLQELRKFLIDTIPIQTRYLIYRLETILPQILELVPISERSIIRNKISGLMQTPIGIYSLVDYVNFKGDGIVEYKKSPVICDLLQQNLKETQQVPKNLVTNEVYGCGWGLLQVLRDMSRAPKKLTINEAFAWAAGEALKRRVAFAPEERKEREQRWLVGWLKRIDTYRYKEVRKL